MLSYGVRTSNTTIKDSKSRRNNVVQRAKPENFGAGFANEEARREGVSHLATQSRRLGGEEAATVCDRARQSRGKREREKPLVLRAVSRRLGQGERLTSCERTGVCYHRSSTLKIEVLVLLLSPSCKGVEENGQCLFVDRATEQCTRLNLRLVVGLSFRVRACLQKPSQRSPSPSSL